MTPVAILTAALCSPVGIVVETPEPEKLKQKLYQARKANLPAFRCLSFLTSRTSPTTELWIVNNDQENHEAVRENPPSSV